MPSDQFKASMNKFRLAALPFAVIPLGFIAVSLFWPFVAQDNESLEIAYLCTGAPIGVIILLAWVVKDQFDEAVQNIIGKSTDVQ